MDESLSIHETLYPKAKGSTHRSVRAVDTMLLWIPPSTGLDEDEKHAKLQRESRSRTQRALLGLTVLALCFIVVLSFLENTREVPSNRLRMSDRETVDSQRMYHLPADSIYRLSVENQQGELVSLRQYAGNVTLVVNTACK